jgi:ADP-dependent NAD(P)H-hydrate dehydratase
MPGARPPIALDAQTLRSWPLPVDEHGDKHARGTVLVVGAAPSTLGAVLLAGLAALRMGAGRLQIAAASSTLEALAVAVPEAMTVELPHHRDGRLRPHRAERSISSLVSAADSILIGPGLQTGPATSTFVREVLAGVGPDAVVVLDAAALRALRAGDPNSLEQLRGRLVVTPNRQEAARMVRSQHLDADAGEEEVLASVADTHAAIVSSFGTVCSFDGRRWDAGQGGPGLGTSGSGDVLAGLVAGAAARSKDALQAACWATYVHTIIGQRLSSRMGRLGFIARDLVDEVPHVMATLDGA